jgi:hypothetical protein
LNSRDAFTSAAFAAPTLRLRRAFVEEFLPPPQRFIARAKPMPRDANVWKEMGKKIYEVL